MMILYVVPFSHVQDVASLSIRRTPDVSSIAHADSRQLLESLAAGCRIAAMTTLRNGDVLFAIEAS